MAASGGGSSAAAGIQAAGTAFSAVSSYYQGKWAKQLANYNAKVAKMQGQYALERGEQMGTRQRMATGQLRGAQRVAYAGQNVLLDDGTAAQANEQAAYWGEIDAITVRNNAALEAWGYKQAAVNSVLSGQMSMAQGMANATGTILGGAGRIASSYEGSSSASSGSSGGG
jgi:hypothetical protein